MSVTTLRLPAGMTAACIGDLHLGDRSRNDLFGTHDEVLVRFLEDCPGTYDVVVLMGDVIDLPQGFTAGRILTAHPGVRDAISALSARMPVVLVRGNHDWWVDYGRVFPAVRVCEDLHLGDVLIWHGHRLDRFCHTDERSYLWQMRLHHLAERLFGFEFRTPLHAHASWQNRTAHWLGHKYGLQLQRKAAKARRRGDVARARGHEDFIDYWSRAVWGDSHAFFEPIKELLRTGPHEAIVCGHTHMPGVMEMAGRRYVNAGSWAFGAAEVATFDGVDFGVRDVITDDQITDERYRWMLEGVDPGNFFDWWDRHYLGRLKFRPTNTSVEDGHA